MRPCIFFCILGFLCESAEARVDGNTGEVELVRNITVHSRVVKDLGENLELELDMQNHLFPRDQQLFSLLDRDENGFIDFRDILVFLFSTKVSLSPEEARLRSFRFYDRSVLTWILEMSFLISF